MAATMNLLTLLLARKLLDVRESEATGGSATTLVDTTVPASVPVDTWLNGTIWFRTGARAVTSAIVTVNNPASTFTFATGGVVAAGDDYAIAQGFYTRFELFAAINEALRELGPYMQVDASAGLKFSANKYEYLVSDFSPALVARNIKILEYKLAGEDWYRVHQNFRQMPPDGRIILDAGHLPPDTTPFRCWYEAPHPDSSTFYLDATEISAFVNEEWVVWAAVRHAIRRRYIRTKQQAPETADLVVQANQALTSLHSMRETDAGKITEPPHLANW